jgi:hypothetical protein
VSPEIDVDAELDAWYDANYGSGFVPDPRDASHRCAPDVPPCPDCQALDEREDSNLQ